MSINNPQVLNGLPAAESGQQRIYAYLILESVKQLKPGDTPLFTFLANPEELRWSRQAQYAEAVTAATSVQSQQYYHTKGRVLQISDLLLDAYYAKRSIRPLLEQLQALLVPDAKNQNWYAPKVLDFVWGSSRFGPCVLTELSCKEKAWRNGAPATALLNMTLLEVPPPDTDPATRINPPESKDDAKGKLDRPLTDRQRQEGSSEAQKWLKANTNSLPASLRDRVRANRYRLTTAADTGLSTITDEKGNSLGTVGRWNGRTFTTDQVQGFTQPK